MRVLILTDTGVNEEVDILANRQRALHEVYPEVTVSVLGDTSKEEIVARVDETTSSDRVVLGLIGEAPFGTDRHYLVGLLQDNPPLGFIVNRQVWADPHLKKRLIMLTSGAVPTRGGSRMLLLR